MLCAKKRKDKKNLNVIESIVTITVVNILRATCLVYVNLMAYTTTDKQFGYPDNDMVNTIIVVLVEVKSAYEPSGPSGLSLSAPNPPPPPFPKGSGC